MILKGFLNPSFALFILIGIFPIVKEKKKEKALRTSTSN